VTWGNRAREGSVGLIIDRLGEVDEHRNITAGQEVERRRQDAVLETRVMGSAEWSPERELTVQHPRRPRPFGLRSDQAESDRG
jgi:hypothetical protein